MDRNPTFPVIPRLALFPMNTKKKKKKIPLVKPLLTLPARITFPLCILLGHLHPAWNKTILTGNQNFVKFWNATFFQNVYKAIVCSCVTSAWNSIWHSRCLIASSWLILFRLVSYAYFYYSFSTLRQSTMLCLYFKNKQTCILKLFKS